VSSDAAVHSPEIGTSGWQLAVSIIADFPACECGHNTSGRDKHIVAATRCAKVIKLANIKPESSERMIMGIMVIRLADAAPADILNLSQSPLHSRGRRADKRAPLP
jgi:hypothetical protein